MGAAASVSNHEKVVTAVQSRYRGRKGREVAEQKSREFAYTNLLNNQEDLAKRRHSERMRKVRQRKGKMTEDDILYNKTQLDNQLLEIVKEREDREARNEARKLKQAKIYWKKSLKAVIFIQSLARAKYGPNQVLSTLVL